MVAIITLIAGILIVCISFFVVDGHNFKEEDQIYNESAEDLKLRLTELCDTLVEQNKAAITEYSQDIRDKQEQELKETLEKCAGQLSEKAKKEMIDYINQSLAEAFEAYNPESNEQPEPLRYEESEPSVQTEDKDEKAGHTDDTAEKEGISAEEVKESEKPDDSKEQVSDAQTKEEDTEAINHEGMQNNKDTENNEILEDSAGSENMEEHGNPVKSEESSVKTEPVSETKQNVKTQEQEIVVSRQERDRNKTQKKNRNKSRTQEKKQTQEKIKTEEIWDEEKDIASEVERLYSDGYSMIEIANQLGIGVGETKVMIDKIKKDK